MDTSFIIGAALASVSAALGSADAVVTDQAPSAIVVTARKAADPKTVRSVVRSISHQLDTGGGDYQMARWIDPVCPVALGLAPLDAKSLEDDVRAVASRIGAPVGGSSCEWNIEIIVTSDPRSALLDEQSRQPWFFRGIPQADVATMIDGSASVRWGSATKTYSADGTPMRLDGTVYDADGSRLHAATQTGLGRMIVIVDRDKASAIPTSTLHDLISFVALAQIRMKVVPDNPTTILTAMGENHDDAISLQPFDIAYLRALYSVGPSLRGSAQQSAMAHQVALSLSR